MMLIDDLIPDKVDFSDGYSDYLADVDARIEEIAGRVTDASDVQPETLAALATLYLLKYSLGDWAARLSPAVVIQAVKSGHWQVERALSLAGQIPDEERRATMFGKLSQLDTLPSESMGFQRQAFDAASAIDFAAIRARALQTLAEQADESLRNEVLDGALKAALEDADSVYGGNGFGLWSLIPQLPEALIEPARNGVRGLKNAQARAWAYAALAFRAPYVHEQHELLRSGVDAARQIVGKDVEKANAWAQLVPMLPPDMAHEAFESIIVLAEPEWIPRAVSQLVQHLTPEQQLRLLDRLLTIENDWWRADGLIALMPHSEGAVRQRTLESLLTTTEEEARGKVISWLLNGADAATREQAEEMAANRPDLPFHDLFSGIQTAQETAEKTLQRGPLLQLSEEAAAASNLDQLSDLLSIPYPEDSAPAIARAAPSLEKSQLAAVIAHVLRYDEFRYQDTAFDGLAPQLTNELLTAALDPKPEYYALVNGLRIYGKIADLLPARQRKTSFESLVTALEQVSNPWWLIDTLNELLTTFPDDLRRKLAQHFYPSVKDLEVNGSSVKTLVKLIPFLSQPLQAEAIALAEERLWTYDDRTEGLKLIYKADSDEFRSSLDMARAERIQSAANLLPFVSDEQAGASRGEALNLLNQITTAIWKAMAVKALVGKLTPNQRAELIDQVFVTARTPAGAAWVVNLISDMMAEVPVEEQAALVARTLPIATGSRQASLLLAVTKANPTTENLQQAEEAVLALENLDLCLPMLLQLLALGSTTAAEKLHELLPKVDDHTIALEIRTILADNAASVPNSHYTAWILALQDQDREANSLSEFLGALTWLPFPGPSTFDRPLAAALMGVVHDSLLVWTWD